MEPLTRNAIAAAEEGDFKIHPPSWGKPYLEWLKGLKDWCISRQIWWGHRIPVWYCARCAPMLMFFEDDVVLTAGPNKGMKVRQYHSDLLLKGGLDLDFLLSAAVSMQFLGEFDAAKPAKGILVQMERPGRCGTCGGAEFIQDPDVLDTWFSSALWPMSVFGWPEKNKDLDYYYPTSVLVTGYEILYLWVARMQMMGLEFLKKPPFADAVIHGIVRDKSGKKMSKSLGNVVDPLEMMERFGTDALRFSLVMQAYPGKDIPFAPDSITGSRNFANKLWNSTRFVLMNLPGGFKVERGSAIVLADKASQRGWELADCWIVSEYRRMLSEVSEELETYNAAAAADSIYAFFLDYFCDWYIELAKPRLTGPDGAGKEAAQGILVGVLVNTLKLLHPFMPFITEELYGALKPYCPNETADFLLKSALPGATAGGGFAHDPASMKTVMEIVTALRSLRAQLNVPPGLKIRVLSTGAERASQAILAAHGDYIKTLAHLETLETAPAGKRPSHCATAVAAGMSFFVPLEGIIDFAKQRERINKEMAKAEAEVSKIAQKVANPDFLSRAPEAEVALARTQHEAALARQARLRETLQILSD
jgi:valyl-tRNA synthetase